MPREFIGAWMDIGYEYCGFLLKNALCKINIIAKLNTSISPLLVSDILNDRMQNEGTLPLFSVNQRRLVKPDSMW